MASHGLYGSPFLVFSGSRIVGIGLPFANQNRWKGVPEGMRIGDRVKIWIYGDDSLVKGKMGTVHELDNAGMFLVRLDDGQVVMVMPGIDRVVEIDR
jgi:hypothetical protein